MIGFWIITGIVSIGIAIGLIWLYWAFVVNSSKKRGTKPQDIVVYILISVLCIAGAGFFGNWYLYSTASGQRTRISWQSEISLGLERNVQVFSATGEKVFEFSGRFDIDQDEQRILLDVYTEGKVERIYISAPAGVVIIRETQNSE